MSMKVATCLFALGILASGPTSTPAKAATLTTSFGVSVTVQASCLVTASSMTFGTYSGAAVNATSTVSVTCTNSTPYNVGLSAGMATGSIVDTRKMTGPGSATLGYALASNSQGTVNWGQTVGTDTVAGTGNGSTQALTVRGQIPAGQYVAPGSYSDSVTVTVTY